MAVRLGKFERGFLKRIKDYKKIHLNPEKCVCYIIYKNNQKVGVIGFHKKRNNYFLKIGIHQDFRGQDFFKKALDLLMKKHRINKIYSTIVLTNKKAISAHRKLGFRKIPYWKEEDLKAKGYLLKRNIRMVKSWHKK